MTPRLGELLYWMACWIAATVAILGLAAILQGGRMQDWVGTFAFFCMSAAIWLIGRLLMLWSREK